MQLPLEYMLKMSVCLAVTYTFYHLLLRRITHYTWNRWYFLVCTVLSFIIPAVNINVFVQQQQLNHIYFINRLPAIYTTPAINTITNPSSWDVQTVAAIVFIAGIAVLALRLVVQFLSLLRLQANAKLVSNGDIKLYHLENSIAPFSFNNSIYCNNNMYDRREMEEVIRHELVHVKQKHTADVLLAEILCLVNWYNPFAWMIKSAMKENLEFIADDTVLQQGISRQNYQYLILKVTGNMPYAIASNLNFSSLKKRIAMMNKHKTSKAHLLKFLFIVPVISCLLVAFRQGGAGSSVKAKQEQSASPENFTLGSLTYFINDTKAEALVKNDAKNSLLQPGGVLTLALMRDEKSRLTGLLQKNGFSNIDSHAITFLMDTSSASKSFSVQVTINIPGGHVTAVKGNSVKSSLANGKDDSVNGQGETFKPGAHIAEDNTFLQQAVTAPGKTKPASI
ncbi:MAG TPA: M56 family metallopeptidase [Chitinophagaceae bacterium]|nr:M56 family metallopeptidase [Chitinophagaceae bacterium]